MTEVPTASGAVSLTAEPARRVGKRWIALIALANLGLYLGYFGPITVLLPNQVQAIAGSAHKVAALGWVTAIGAAVAMISNPVAGALSDRTTSRFGRRHPWTVFGALAGAAALVLLAGQHAIVGVIIGWCLAQAGLNAMQASITAGCPTMSRSPSAAPCRAGSACRRQSGWWWPWCWWPWSSRATPAMC
jgi:MFS family permease